MNLEQSRVVEHKVCTGDYRLLVIGAASIAAAAKPGQFVHLRVPGLEAAVLRRPFSILSTSDDCISILYKPVGKGTRMMTQLAPDAEVSLMGPLGNGFREPDPRSTPVVVAGGYGVAPLLFLARECGREGVAFIGGATADDILCAEDFAKLSWDVRVATEDGSVGTKGFVTKALDDWIGSESPPDREPEVFACGPEGMLKAVGERAIENGWHGWLSLDRRMGCGVGACLVCVQRIQDEDGNVKWARVCRDGPVFEAREIFWD